MTDHSRHTNEENTMPSTQHQPHIPPANTDDPLRERDLAAIVGGGVKVDFAGLDQVVVRLSTSQFDRLVEAAAGWREHHAGRDADLMITITEANKRAAS